MRVLHVLHRKRRGGGGKARLGRNMATWLGEACSITGLCYDTVGITNFMHICLYFFFLLPVNRTSLMMIADSCSYSYAVLQCRAFTYMFVDCI